MSEPSRSVGDGLAAAKAVCATCSVCQPCLDYAVADATLAGVWGGYTERERHELRAGRQPADRSSPREEQPAKREPAPRRERKPCGTATYARHRRRGEAACDACKEAKRLKFAQSTRRRRKRGEDDATDQMAAG